MLRQTADQICCLLFSSNSSHSRSRRRRRRRSSRSGFAGHQARKRDMRLFVDCPLSFLFLKVNFLPGEIIQQLTSHNNTSINIDNTGSKDVCPVQRISGQADTRWLAGRPPWLGHRLSTVMRQTIGASRYYPAASSSDSGAGAGRAIRRRAEERREVRGFPFRGRNWKKDTFSLWALDVVVGCCCWIRLMLPLLPCASMELACSLLRLIIRVAPLPMPNACQSSALSSSLWPPPELLLLLHKLAVATQTLCSDQRRNRQTHGRR